MALPAFLRFGFARFRVEALKKPAKPGGGLGAFGEA
jgi:hypothetical protein